MDDNLIGGGAGPAPGNSGQGKGGGMKVDPRDLNSLECDCGNDRFKEQYFIKTMSELQSPTGKEEVFPFQVFACTECGKVPNELLPEGIE